MNAKPNPLSKTTRAKSLLAAVTIAVGLHSVLLWQMNEVANAGAQSALLAARAPVPATAPAPAPGPAQAAPTPTYLLVLEPVTIVARRESGISELRVASVNKQGASSVVDRAKNAM